MNIKAEPRRREAKKQATRERLYNSALELFRERGYDKVSVADITARADTAKGTFFNYFETKADVLAAWYEDVLAPPSAVPGHTLDELLNWMLGELFSVIEAEPELLEAKIDYESQTPAIIEAEARVDARLRSLIEAAIIRDHGKSPADGLTPAGLADLVVTLLTGAARGWRTDKRDISLSDYTAAHLHPLRKLISLACD